MKKIISKINIAVFATLLSINHSNAQSSDSTNAPQMDSTTYVFTISNKNEVYGTIIKEDPRETTIKSQDGRILIIPSYEITSRKPISQVTTVNGKVVFKNPHPSRYFYGPSALPMEKNELYVNSVYFLSAQVQYGISENFSAGITTSFLLSPIALTAKYTLKLDESNHIALGGLAGSFSWIDPEEYLGLGFVSYTLGNSESNITASAGILQTSTTSSSPLFNLGTHQRLGKHLSFMGEFYYIPELETTITAPFLRMYFNKTTCWDIGLLFIRTDDYSFPLPAFSYTFKFNQD